MKHYAYVTTNFINGKKYVGDHSTNDLDDGYLGSGNLFTEKVKEYGRDNFKKEIIEFFDTKLEAFAAQEKYIKLYESHVSQNGYNLSWKGGHNVKDCISEETKEKMSKARIGKPHPQENFNRIHGPSKETREKISKANKGRVLTKEWKNKISESQKGRVSPNKGKTMSEEQKRKISEGVKKRFVNNPPNVGKKHSEESKQKMGQARIGSKRSEETKQKMRDAWVKRKEIKNLNK